MIEAILNDEHFASTIENEFEELINSIIGIRDKSALGFEGQCTLETREILVSLIKLTDVNEIKIAPQFTALAFKILRKVIEMENVQNTKPAADWETEDWANYAEAIEERQELLAELDVVGLLCRVVSTNQNEPLDEEVFEEAILVAIACLLGGNATVQQKFFEYMQRDNNNRFLQTIKDKMMEKFEKIQEKELEKIKRRHDMKRYNLADDDEKTGEELDTEKFEEQSHAKTMTFLIRILRFMQLLCENHNIKLQNHLRKQKSPEDTLIARNTDFVTQLAVLLGMYQKLFNSETISLGNQIIDCLIEFI